MSERGFRHEDHTADLRVRAWGKNLEEAFAEAARGMIAYMVEVDRAPFERVRQIRVEARTLDRLLVAFLDDVLYALLADLVVLGRFDVSIERTGTGYVLRCEARGAPYSEVRHGHIHEVKAITLHEAKVGEGNVAEARAAEVAVLLDI